MLETPHVVVAAALATQIPNPYIALPLALASHFALDTIPHWNPHLNIDLKNLGKISTKHNYLNLVDSSTALILGIYLASRVLPDLSHAIIILIACFLSVLPDIIKIPFYYFKGKNKLLKRYIVWDKGIQSDTTPFWGFITQSITIVTALWWILGN